jgi:hypothetical protein
MGPSLSAGAFVYGGLIMTNLRLIVFALSLLPTCAGASQDFSKLCSDRIREVSKQPNTPGFLMFLVVDGFKYKVDECAHQLERQYKIDSIDENYFRSGMRDNDLRGSFLQFDDFKRGAVSIETRLMRSISREEIDIVSDQSAKDGIDTVRGFKSLSR